MPRPNPFAALMLAAALVAGPVAAASDGPVAEGDVLGTGVPEISAALAARGYDVRKVERERDAYEAKAMRDGDRWEIYVDRGTGAVRRVKRDD